MYNNRITATGLTYNEFGKITLYEFLVSTNQHNVDLTTITINDVISDACSPVYLYLPNILECNPLDTILRLEHDLIIRQGDEGYETPLTLITLGHRNLTPDGFNDMLNHINSTLSVKIKYVFMSDKSFEIKSGVTTEIEMSHEEYSSRFKYVTHYPMNDGWNEMSKYGDKDISNYDDVLNVPMSSLVVENPVDNVLAMNIKEYLTEVGKGKFKETTVSLPFFKLYDSWYNDNHDNVTLVNFILITLYSLYDKREAISEINNFLDLVSELMNVDGGTLRT